MSRILIDVKDRTVTVTFSSTEEAHNFAKNLRKVINEKIEARRKSDSLAKNLRKGGIWHHRR
jgi:hypothetical protein